MCLFKKRKKVVVPELSEKEKLENKIKELEDRRFDINYASKSFNGEIKRILKDLDNDKSQLTLKYVKANLRKVLTFKARLKRISISIGALISDIRQKIIMTDLNLTAKGLNDMIDSVLKTLNLSDLSRENEKIDSVLDKAEDLLFPEGAGDIDIENEINELISSKLSAEKTVSVEPTVTKTVSNEDKKADSIQDEIDKILAEIDKK